VNLHIGRTFAPRPRDVFGDYELAIALHLTRNCEQRFQLRRTGAFSKSVFTRLHHVLSAQMTSYGPRRGWSGKKSSRLRRAEAGDYSPQVDFAVVTIASEKRVLYEQVTGVKVLFLIRALAFAVVVALMLLSTGFVFAL